MTVGNQPTSAGQSAQPTGQDIWQTCLAQDHMTFETLEDELVAALLSWAARQPEDGPVPAAHQPLSMRIDDFIDKLGCAHIHSDVLAKVQAEMYRRGVCCRFTDEAGAGDGGAWVQVWLTDYLALGLPGTVKQLRRSRGWFRWRAFDTDARIYETEQHMLRCGEGTAGEAHKAALVARLRTLKHERARIQESLAQMDASHLEPEV